MAAYTRIDEIPFFGNALKIRRFRLRNGLLVVLVADPSAPVISYHTWYHVGSASEKLGKTGLAHLFEHLMFNQSKGFKQGQFDRLIEEAGGSSNAATWLDWTFYYESVPKDALELIIDLESDRMTNLVLQDKQVSSEKEVVANERRYRVDDDVEGRAQEELFALAFNKHPYGWPTIGWMRDIENFTKEDCWAFYRTYYAPNNATIVLTGDIDEHYALGLINKAYGHLPAAKIPKTKLVKEPTQKKERSKTLMLEAQGERLNLGYKAPAITHNDHAALSVAAELLFGGRSARVTRKLVYEKELATEARGSVHALREPGLFEIWFALRPGKKANAALSILETEIDTLAKGRIAKRELDKIRAQVELAFLSDMESASGKAEQLGFYESTCGHSKWLFKRLEQLRAVTVKDVARVSKTYLQTSQRTRIHVLPTESAT